MGDLGGRSYAASYAVTNHERSWAMAAHLCALLGSAVPFGNLLGPLAIWLFHRNKSYFIGKHAKESLSFQAGLFVAVLVLVGLLFTGSGAGIALAVLGTVVVMLASLIYMILATLRANEGKLWEYPITSRLVS